jgi:hypothetical protein
MSKCTIKSVTARLAFRDGQCVCVWMPVQGRRGWKVRKHRQAVAAAAAIHNKL